MKDPHGHPLRHASRTSRCCEKRLQVMDATAISLCMDNQLPILVFNLRTPGNLRRAVLGEPVGSVVSVDPSDGLAEQCIHGRERSQGPVRRSEDADGRRRRARAEGAGQRPHGARVDGPARSVHVEAYGSKMPLNQVAGLSIPEPSLIVAQPYDPSTLARDREGDPLVRSGPQPGLRRQGDPDPDSGAHRRAPQGAVTPRAQAGRGRPQRACARSGATPTSG